MSRMGLAEGQACAMASVPALASRTAAMSFFMVVSWFHNCPGMIFQPRG
jgi:hypothetical protein